MIIFAVVTALSLSISALRLVCYQRQGARFKRSISMLAYLLIVCLGGGAIDIVLNHSVVHWWQAGIAVVFAVLVWRARGNVAVLTRAIS